MNNKLAMLGPVSLMHHYNQIHDQHITDVQGKGEIVLLVEKFISIYDKKILAKYTVFIVFNILNFIN